MTPDRAATIARIGAAVEAGDDRAARAILAADYPFVPLLNQGRHYSIVEMTRVFLRDGFVDRYTGRRLVHPGALRILSLDMPAEFPYHKNGRLDRCHIAFWELFPTIDHIIPVSRGGADDASNWVTTSMTRNAAKANWTLDEIGWTLLSPGDLADWDGMTAWFLRQCDARPALLRNARIRDWRRAARRVAAERSM